MHSFWCSSLSYPLCTLLFDVVAVVFVSFLVGVFASVIFCVYGVWSYFFHHSKLCIKSVLLPLQFPSPSFLTPSFLLLCLSPCLAEVLFYMNWKKKDALFNKATESLKNCCWKALEKYFYLGPDWDFYLDLVKTWDQYRMNDVLLL